MLRNNTYSWAWFSMALMAALLFNGEHIYYLSMCWLMLVFFVLHQLTQHVSLNIRLDFTSVLCMLFVSWLLVALLWHPVSWQGVYFNWRIGVYPFVLLMTYYLFREKDLPRVFNGILLVGVLVALLTLFQSVYLSQPANGLFLNKNNNAALLNLFALPLLASVLFRDRSWRERWFNGLLFAVFVLAILQTASRGGILALLLSASFLVVIALRQRRTKNLAFVVVVFVATLLLNAVFSSVELRVYAQSTSRWLLWGSAVEMLLAADWMGIGNGMFSKLYPPYRAIGENSAGLFVHNDYLQVLLELGIPGIIFFALMFLNTLYHGRKLIIKDDSSPGDPILIGMLAAIMAVAIHSLVSYNLYKVSIIMILGLYTGLILRQGIKGAYLSSPSYALKISRSTMVIILFLLLLSIKSVVLMGYTDSVADGFVDKGLVSSSPEKRMMIYEELRKLDKANYVYPYLMAETNGDFGVNSDVKVRSEVLQKTRTLLLEARELDPFAVETYSYEASLLAMFSDVAGSNWRDSSIALYAHALSLNPHMHTKRFRMAVLLNDMGNKQLALDTLLGGVDSIRGPAHLPYYQYGIKLAEEQGDREAVRLFSDLASKNSSFP